jgi:hypothetical protein
VTPPTQSPQDAKRNARNGAAGRWSERQMEIVEARVERLEAALEGLQDAIHRQAVLRDEQIDELDRPTKPHQIARALSQDARKARSLTGSSRRIAKLHGLDLL